MANTTVLPTRTTSVAAALVAAFGISACDHTKASPCEAIGVCNERLKPAMAVDVLCDASVGSSCTEATFEKAIDRVLREIADRPGSLMRVWALGETVGATVAVAEQTIPSVPRTPHRSRGARLAAMTASTRKVLVAGARHVFDAPPIRRSPIAESVVKIAMAGAEGDPRHLVILSDAREVSAHGDFECYPIPSAVQFSSRLARSAVLLPGQLFGLASVSLVHVTAASTPSRGCAVTVDREVQIRGLWKAVLRSAGAGRVTITSGPLPSSVFDDAPPDGGAP